MESSTSEEDTLSDETDEDDRALRRRFVKHKGRDLDIAVMRIFNKDKESFLRVNHLIERSLGPP